MKDFDHNTVEALEDELVEDEFREYIRQIFYPPEIIDDAQGNEQQLSKSCDFIHKYLKKLFPLYSENELYNEYKHGLRWIGSRAEVEMRLDNVDDLDTEKLLEDDSVEKTDEGIQWTGADDEGLAYLDWKLYAVNEETDKKFWTLEWRIRPVEFDLYRGLCELNAHLIDHMFSVVRIADQIGNGESEEEKIGMYGHHDVDEVFRADNPLLSYGISTFAPKDDNDLYRYDLK